MEHKVVKCTNSKCRLYFGHTEKSTKCPFCKTEYGEKKVEEKPVEEKLEKNFSKLGKIIKKRN